MALNNFISLKGPKDVNDSLRKLDRLKEKDGQNFQLSRVVDLKLLRKQREAIYTNRLLLLLHANKMNQVLSFSPEVLSLVLQVDIMTMFISLISSGTCCYASWHIS